MSEIRAWRGLPYKVEGLGHVTYCEECSAPILDTPEARQAHKQRVHSVKPKLERLPPTEPFVKQTRSRLSKDKAYLCEACRDGHCLLCDGGTCRCVCSLELDKRRVRKAC